MCCVCRPCQTLLPWSSSLFVSTREAAYAKAKSIQSFVHWARLSIEEFLEADAASPAGKMLANTYRLTGAGVIAWSGHPTLLDRGSKSPVELLCAPQSPRLSSVRWWCRCEALGLYRGSAMGGRCSELICKSL